MMVTLLGLCLVGIVVGSIIMAIAFYIAVIK
jgi:hypothetical protein